jgi:hypothetical protein
MYFLLTSSWLRLFFLALMLVMVATYAAAVLSGLKETEMLSRGRWVRMTLEQAAQQALKQQGFTTDTLQPDNVVYALRARLLPQEHLAAVSTALAPNLYEFRPNVVEPHAMLFQMQPDGRVWLWQLVNFTRYRLGPRPNDKAAATTDKAESVLKTSHPTLLHN